MCDVGGANGQPICLLAAAHPHLTCTTFEFGDAFDFTGADFIGWCREAGFRRF